MLLNVLSALSHEPAGMDLSAAGSCRHDTAAAFSYAGSGPLATESHLASMPSPAPGYCLVFAG
jgi:hypothetical protein